MSENSNPGEFVLDDTPPAASAAVSDTGMTPTPEDTPTDTAPTEPADALSGEDEGKYLHLRLPHQNVHIQFSPFTSLTEADKKRPVSISLPGAALKSIVGSLSNIPNVELQNAEYWQDVMKDGAANIEPENVFAETAEDSTAEFVQAVDTDTGRLAPGYPTYKKVSNEALTGERAVLRFMDHVNLGGVVRVPCWNTGMWITIKPPSDSRLHQLSRQILDDKIRLGRHTMGAVYNNITIYYMDALIETIFSHIYQTNLKTNKSYAQVMSCHDIVPLVTMLAASIYRNGVPYQRACTFDPAKCIHVVEEKLDISKLLWVNRKALTKKQLSILSKSAAGSITEDDLIAYREENYKALPRTVKIKGDSADGFTIKLKVPTIAEHLASGHGWVGDIVQMVNTALGMDASQNARNQYINEQAAATELRQYGHWIENIIYDDNVSFETRDDLDSALDALSSDAETREEILKAVRKFITDSTLTVVGVPTYECPSCKKTNIDDSTSEVFKGIIPLNVYRTFFQLIVQLKNDIESRSQALE